MKLLILSLFSFMVCIQTSLTQKTLYLDLGYNHSDITSNYLSAAYKSGYFGGLTFENIYSNNFEASAGVRLNRLGAKTINGGTGYTFIDGVFNIGYRLVPAITFQSGMSIGALLRGVPELVERKFDFGAHFGVKYNLVNYTIKAHFYRGLLDQSKGTRGDKAFFQYFKVGIGIRLIKLKQEAINSANDARVKAKRRRRKRR